VTAEFNLSLAKFLRQKTNMVALVLVRFLGLIGLIFGASAGRALPAVVISAVGSPAWVTSVIWGYRAQVVLPGPLWFAAGLFCPGLPGPLLRFVAKGH
jgi:hypothetical protein